MHSAVDDARAFSRANSVAFLDQLSAFLRIPSLSGSPEFASDVAAAADWLAQNMRESGLEHVAVMPTAGHPVVYGDWLGAGQEKQTELDYVHYEVLPASKEEG